MKRSVFIFFMIFSCVLYGRNYTELQEWREKRLPMEIKSGVQVEIYDFESRQGVRHEYPAVNIRIHNKGSSTVDELVIALWFWYESGVYVKELILIGEKGEYRKKLFSGEEKYMPGERRYYSFKNLKFDEITNLEMKISRIKTR